MQESVPKKEKKISEERINEVRSVVAGLLDMVSKNALKEVDSAQPENLHQYEAKDSNGNEITYIRDMTGNLASQIEVRDSKGKLIAQSWDESGWSVDSYIETGVDFSIE